MGLAAVGFGEETDRRKRKRKKVKERGLGRTNLLRERVERRLPPADEDDAETGLCELVCELEPDAGRAARDDGVGRALGALERRELVSAQSRRLPALKRLTQRPRLSHGARAGWCQRSRPVGTKG